MKYSLVLHARGTEPENLGVYLTNANLTGKENDWWHIGLIQKIRFEAFANDFITKLSLDTIGFDIRPTDPPDFRSGIVVYASDYVSLQNKTSSMVSKNVFVLQHNSRVDCEISLQTCKPLGGLQRILVEASVEKGFTNVEIDYHKNPTVENLPEWVKAKEIEISKDRIVFDPQ